MGRAGDAECGSRGGQPRVNLHSKKYVHLHPFRAPFLCCDDVRAERAPRVRGVHGGLRGTLGVHVAHFRLMCLTARNSPRHPTSPIMFLCPARAPARTRFDVRSSRGGWPERTPGERPHVLGVRVVAWLAVIIGSCRLSTWLVPFAFLLVVLNSCTHGLGNLQERDGEVGSWQTSGHSRSLFL